MSLLANAAGGSVYMDYTDEQGRKLKLELKPMEMADFAAIENELLRRMVSPLKTAMPMIKELEKEGLTAQANAVALRAYADQKDWAQRQSDRLSITEVREWIDTLDGARFTILLMLRKTYPDVQIDLVDRLVEQQGAENVIEARDRASATDLLGNSNGESEKAAPLPMQAEASRGAESIVASPTPISGRQPKLIA
jgi:hypothetical protein